MITYYDLMGNNKTLDYSDFGSRDAKDYASIEGFSFTPDAPKNMVMTTDISTNNLIQYKTELSKDPTMDYSTTVSDPNGYGYVPSLNETRNQDAKDILNQESSVFTIGAIAGVSLIVFSILIASNQTAAQ